MSRTSARRRPSSARGRRRRSRPGARRTSAARTGPKGYAGDYDVWLLTRQEDLQAAQQQVESLVESIKSAAKSYDSTDADARDAFLKALDSGFERIDR